MPKEIKIIWDEEAQAATMQFKGDDFRTWDMVVAVLDMVKSQAEFNRNMGRMQAVQQVAQDQARTMAIKSKLQL